MNYAHGYREYHGQLNVTGLLKVFNPFDFGKPPRWAVKLQWRSQSVVSFIVEASCYWAGRFLFGMSGEYVEYTPPMESSTAFHDDKVR